MFEEALFGNAKATLAILGESKLLNNAYLAGGTALALQLGHRVSFDLDFFTPKEFDYRSVCVKLKKIIDFKVDEARNGTILGKISDIKFSLFVYKYKVLFSFKKFLGINILDLRDIAAMKIVAISDRGIKRDFVDLCFICKTGISLNDILNFYDKKYEKLASNLIHIKKSLVYFADAEGQETPRMLKLCNWNEVKKFFETEVKKIVLKR